MTTDAAPSSIPTSTYRVQLHAGFTFGDLAARVPYLADLGISHVYLSPVLQAAPGSMHGYDVVDHTRLSEDLGGDKGFAELTDALRAAGMSAVVDVVPNHMAIPTPARLNPPWWDVLRHGRESAYARWFDIDWEAGQVVLPVLGAGLGECLDRGEVRVEDHVLRYFDAEFPLRPGTEGLPLPEALKAQHYRLAFWRTGTDELTYRRFFDVTTLTGVRVEDPEVFEATHRRLLELVADGSVTGLRIDHPDGLADPRGYLDRLADATGGVWTVVEKILEGQEVLPDDWACAGTTGYDAMGVLGGLFVDPDGWAELTRSYAALTGEPATFAPVVEQAKREILGGLLAAEVNRLLRVLIRIGAADASLAQDPAALREALVELLVAFPVYRAYVVPGEPAPEQAVAVLGDAAAAARTRLPVDRHAALDVLRDLALGRRSRSADKDEFVVRFQQTCGPAMAKSVEDTAFYRWFPLASANEVGGGPDHAASSPEQFFAWCEAQQRDHPYGMTSLSTHDTKRSEDVRARMAVLSELPSEDLAGLWGRWREHTSVYRPKALDANTEYLLFQTLLGAWPMTPDRLTAYLEKATREAKQHSTWTDPDPGYDDAVAAFARRALADGRVTLLLDVWALAVARFTRANVLGQKLLQLTVPGVPDVYQGSELVTDSLVDPDNRRAMDYDVRARLLAGSAPAEHDSLDAEKLRLVATTLRLRRDHPDWFTGPGATFTPLPASSPHAVAFARSDSVVVVVTRLAARLDQAGGWGEATVTLPPGRWAPAYGGPAPGAPTYEGDACRLAELLADAPVALLVRSDRP